VIAISLQRSANPQNSAASADPCGVTGQDQS